VLASSINQAQQTEFDLTLCTVPTPNLVLAADGTAALWMVRTAGSSAITYGTWSSSGNMLSMTFQQDESNPFTFYQGQLEYPNIPNRRKFWDKIE
jgi:hypothetical protein